MASPLIYTAQASLLPEHLEQHRRWYTTTHAPRLMGLGFYSCRMFDGPGTRWCNLYEIPGPEIFETNGYKAIGDSDVFMKLNISRFIDLNVTTYAQDRVLDGSGRKLDVAPTMAAPSLSFIRFDWSGADAALGDWLGDAVLANCARAGGLRDVRLLRRHAEHPQLKSNYPRFAAAVEWAQPQAAHDEALDRAAQALGAGASRLSRETFHRRFGLLREDCFAG